MKDNRLKKFNEFKMINEARAEDFENGDKIVFNYKGRDYKGTICDHFGEGVFLCLERPLDGYKADGQPLSEFELYNDEENTPGFTIKNVSKIY